MPESLDAGLSSPGDHPDAGPSSALERNSREMKNMVAAVTSHDNNMKMHSALLSENVKATHEHNTQVGLNTVAVNQFTSYAATLTQELVALTQELVALKANITSFNTTLGHHSGLIKQNTSAMKELRRGF